MRLNGLAERISGRSSVAVIIAGAIALHLLLDRLAIARKLASGVLAQTEFVLATANVFQLFAWYVALALLVAAGADKPASRRDLSFFYLLSGLLALTMITGNTEAFAAVATTGAAYLTVTAGACRKTRAAGIVFLAIAANAFWGPLVFGLCTDEILRVDALLTKAAMAILPTGSHWDNGAILAPDGHRIVILDQCSAFHNLTLALLSYVSLIMYRRQKWSPRDWPALATLCILLVALNGLRIALMASGQADYAYWHNGQGASYFGAAVTLLIALASWLGARHAERAS